MVTAPMPNGDGDGDGDDDDNISANSSEVAALTVSLAELQSEYDAYVASSREIEEELEASLEAALASARTSQNEREESLRIAAAARAESSSNADVLGRLRSEMRISQSALREGERRVEEGDRRSRALIHENSVLREEAEEALERCALLEGEVGEITERSEMEIRRCREEILAVQGDVIFLRSKLAEGEAKAAVMTQLDPVGSALPPRFDAVSLVSGLDTFVADDSVTSLEDGDVQLLLNDSPALAGASESTTFTENGSCNAERAAASAVDDAAEYVKSLEEELETVTEELIIVREELDQALANQGSAFDSNVSQAGLTEQTTDDDADTTALNDVDPLLLEEMENELRRMEQVESNLRCELAAKNDKLTELNDRVERLESDLASSEAERRLARSEGEASVANIHKAMSLLRMELEGERRRVDEAEANAKEIKDIRKKSESFAKEWEKIADEEKLKAERAESELAVERGRRKGLEEELERRTSDGDGDTGTSAGEKQELLEEWEKKYNAAEERAGRAEQLVGNLQRRLSDSKHKMLTVEETSKETVDDDGLDDDVASNSSYTNASLPHLSDLTLLLSRYRSLRCANTDLLTRLQTLQGNIRVCCRVRPALDGIGGRISPSTVLSDGDHMMTQTKVESLSDTEVGVYLSRDSAWRSYGFDLVWGGETSQQSVWEDLKGYAEGVTAGYDTCVFAYGPTGSGKTYTMEGNEQKHHQGLAPRLVRRVLKLLKGRVHKVSVGVLEIYNDEVYDLLSEDGTVRTQKSGLDLRRTPDGKVAPVGLRRVPVETYGDVMNLLKKAKTVRATASTNLNEHSSRSHMITVVSVAAGGVDDAVGDCDDNSYAARGAMKTVSNLYLVDLAGSERVRRSNVSGNEMKEAQHINRSLSALGDVMEALDKKSSHIPYRNSKLTYLLSDSLGGNSRTVMVCTVGPGGDEDGDEAISALSFATRVKRIQLGPATANSVLASRNWEEAYNKQKEALKRSERNKEVAEREAEALRRRVATTEERNTMLEESRRKSVEEGRKLVLLRQSSVDMTARWQKEKTVREEREMEVERLRKEQKTLQHQNLQLAKDRDSISAKLAEKDLSLHTMARDLRLARSTTTSKRHAHRKSFGTSDSDNIVASPKTPTIANGPSKTVAEGEISSLSLPVPPSSHKARRSFIPTPGHAVALVSKNPSSITIPNRATNRPRQHRINKRDSIMSPSSPWSHTSTSSCRDVSKIHEEIRQLLQECEPHKIAALSGLLEKFKGREYLLLNKLKIRYRKTSSTLLTPAVAVADSSVPPAQSPADTGNGSLKRIIPLLPKRDTSPMIADDSSIGGCSTATDMSNRQQTALEKHTERMRQCQSRRS